MPTPPGDPLRKVTLNLYEEDCIILENHYGRGWTEYVRKVTHDLAVLVVRNRNQLQFKRTLADIPEDPTLRKDKP